MIQFSNGEAGLYTAALLHSIFDQAFVLPMSASEAQAGQLPEATSKPN